MHRFIVEFDPFDGQETREVEDGLEIEDDVLNYLGDIVGQVKEAARNLRLQGVAIEIKYHNDFPDTLSATMQVSGSRAVEDDQVLKVQRRLTKNVIAVLRHAILEL